MRACILATHKQKAKIIYHRRNTWSELVRLSKWSMTWHDVWYVRLTMRCTLLRARILISLTLNHLLICFPRTKSDANNVVIVRHPKVKDRGCGSAVLDSATNACLCLIVTFVWNPLILHLFWRLSSHRIQHHKDHHRSPHSFWLQVYHQHESRYFDQNSGWHHLPVSIF